MNALWCFSRASGNARLNQDTQIIFAQNKSILDYAFYKEYTSVKDVIKQREIGVYQDSKDDDSKPSSEFDDIIKVVARSKTSNKDDLPQIENTSRVGLLNSGRVEANGIRLDLGEESKEISNSPLQNYYKKSSTLEVAKDAQKTAVKKVNVAEVLVRDRNSATTILQHITEKRAALQKDLENRRIFIKDMEKRYQSNSVRLSKVNIKVIEFDWLFDENIKNNFLSLINKRTYVEILKIDVIRWILLFQWEHYRYPILIFHVLPLLCYFVSFIFYATFVITPLFTQPPENRHDAGHMISLVIVIVLMVYTIGYEVKQSYNNLSGYIRSVKNWIDLSSLSLNI